MGNFLFFTPSPPSLNIGFPLPQIKMLLVRSVTFPLTKTLIFARVINDFVSLKKKPKNTTTPLCWNMNLLHKIGLVVAKREE